MREYELVIREALKNGLSSERDLPFNSQSLLKCLGFRCGKRGLEVYRELTNPIPGTIDMYYIWPFPQVLVGEKYGILVVRDTVNQEDDVYEISEDHQTLTHVFSIDELTFGKGTMMEMADFGKYVFLTNGVAMLVWNPTLSIWQYIPVSATIPMMRTVCNFKGQAFGGNLVTAWHDCDETFYIWSKIGSLDFTPDEDNEAGYRRCPYGGEVFHTRRLGDYVVGYSSKGITLIAPVAEPAHTFGFKEVCEIGIINRGAVGGDKNKHLFVGSDYILRSVTGEGVSDLGFQHHMEELAGEDIIISFDPSRNDFYIGNSTKTFLLSPYGLTEIKQHPSSVWRRNNATNIIPDFVDSSLSYLCTEPFDVGYKGNKTICSIETDAAPVVNPEAGIDWLYDLTSWNLEHYKPINNQGIAPITVSGNAFRFRLRFEEIYETSKIGYLKARYKMTDLRGIRGVYAPPLRGQDADQIVA